jgi:hypothetical protein
MFRWRRRLLLAPMVLALATGAAPAISAAAAAPAAAADSILNGHYPVTGGSTFIKKINTTVPIGAGTLSSSVDLNTGSSTSTLSLPPASVSFNALGLVPVTSTVELIQNGPATGTVDFANNTVTSTASVTLKIDSMTVAGIPVPIGDRCESKAPTSVTVNSAAGFSIGNGGTLNGTYTIPAFSHCGLQTLLINLLIPGPGNTITLNLGPLQLG